MTRTVVNGSPASAMVGGVMDGSGIPVGAGRSGPSPIRAVDAEARAASVTWSVISDWSTRDCRVYRSVRRWVQRPGRTDRYGIVRTNLHLADIACPRGWGML